MNIYELEGEIEFAERDCPNIHFDEMQEEGVIDAELEAEIMREIMEEQKIKAEEEDEENKKKKKKKKGKKGKKDKKKKKKE